MGPHGASGWTGAARHRILGRMFYWLLTLLIGLLLVGYGVGFALGCRLPPADEGEPDV